jgi:hypothetical protein
MTTTTPKATTVSKSTENGAHDTDGESRVSRVAGTARQAVMDVAATARPVLADAADSAGVAAGVAVREADRLVRTSSDQTLALAGAFAMGSALGLLLGGGNRLLITASVVTSIVTAAAVMDRQEREGA